MKAAFILVAGCFAGLPVLAQPGPQTNAVSKTSTGPAASEGAAGTESYIAPGRAVPKVTSPGPTGPDLSKVRRLSLRDCIALALQHNIDLQIDRYNPEIARYALASAYSGYDPSLLLAGQHDHSEGIPRLVGTNTFAAPVSDDNSFNSSLAGKLPFGASYSLQGNVSDSYGNFQEISQGAASFTVDQPLLKNFWFDNTWLRIRVAKNRLHYSQLGLKWQVIQTITTLEQAYYLLIYDRENVAVQKKAVELAESLVEQNKKKLEVGALAPLDLESAEAQAAQNRAAVLAAQSQLATQERIVKRFITANFLNWANIQLQPSGKLTATHHVLDRQKSWNQALSERPDLMQAKLDVEQMGIQLKYDRNQLLPQLDVFGTYGYNGAGKEFSGALYNIQQMNRRFYTYGGRITVPLGNISARNAYKSDKASQQQIVLTLKRLEEGILISVDNDIGNVQANYEQVLATRAARQYAEAALSAEQTKLQNGKSTVYTVLQMQRDLTTARGNEIQALATYNNSLAQLSRDEGSTLQRLGIDWEAN